MTFGQHIRKIRKANNLNQTELGDILGVSQITICGWERYGKIPDIEMICKIVKKFDAPFEELFEDYF